MGQILDLLQVDSNCTGIKVVRRARAPERSEVTRASLLSLAALGARACRTTFLPVQFASNCSKSSQIFDN